MFDVEPNADAEPESWFVDACVKLLAAVVINAAKDARRGSGDALDFLDKAGVKLADVQPEPRNFFGRRTQEEIHHHAVAHRTKATT